MYKKRIAFENMIVTVECSSPKKGLAYSLIDAKTQSEKKVRWLNGFLYVKNYQKYARVFIFCGIAIKYGRFDKVWQQRAKNTIVKNGKLVVETTEEKYFNLNKGKKK